MAEKRISKKAKKSNNKKTHKRRDKKRNKKIAIDKKGNRSMFPELAGRSIRSKVQDRRTSFGTRTINPLAKRRD